MFLSMNRFEYTRMANMPSFSGIDYSTVGNIGEYKHDLKFSMSFFFHKFQILIIIYA